MPNEVSLLTINEAYQRIRPIVHRTPTMTCETINQLADRTVIFKCENLQKTGSFKYRGATNAVQALDSASASRGVVTHSSGNHAQALALAAKVRGISAHIVMPRTAPLVKKQAVLGYGGNVIECEPTLADRERAAQEIVSQTAGVLIPPFDHYDVIAGQGTIALELLEDHPDLETIVVPVGGGGMISGISVASKAIKPSVRIIGAEPFEVDDASRSKSANQWQPLKPNAQTIADGLTTTLGQLTWPIIQRDVDAIITVTESEIRTAMKLVWERMKLVIEPSAAVGVAVLLSDAFKQQEKAKKVGVILCGGNVSLDKFYW